MSVLSLVPSKGHFSRSTVRERAVRPILKHGFVSFPPVCFDDCVDLTCDIGIGAADSYPQQVAMMDAFAFSLQALSIRLSPQSGSKYARACELGFHGLQI